MEQSSLDTVPDETVENVIVDTVVMGGLSVTEGSHGGGVIDGHGLQSAKHLLDLSVCAQRASVCLKRSGRTRAS